MEPFYQDGYVTIYNGDCREILPNIPSESVDVMWTDPPYGHSNHDGDLNAALNDHRNIQSQPIKNDTPDAFRTVLDNVLTEASRILRHECCCCCCCCGGGPRPTFAWVADRMDKNGLAFFHSVIWDKRNPGLGWRFRRQHEMIMVAHRAGGRLRWREDDLAIPNVYSQMPPRHRLHPNEKPLEMVIYFLQAVSRLNDTILDPFAGSGTTGVAAKKLGRKATLIEVEERYCEIAAKRMAQGVLPLYGDAK